jgi:very-short-patch-repair endonuclease
MRHLNRLLERHAKLVLARELRAHPTPSEDRAWQLLRRKRIGGLRFRRQHVFGKFILDFYCPVQRLAVEIDGGVHVHPDQAAYDTACDEALAEFGVRVVRIRTDDVSEEVLRKVLQPYFELAHPHAMGRGQGRG